MIDQIWAGPQLGGIDVMYGTDFLASRYSYSLHLMHVFTSPVHHLPTWCLLESRMPLIWQLDQFEDWYSIVVVKTICSGLIRLLAVLMLFCIELMVIFFTTEAGSTFWELHNYVNITITSTTKRIKFLFWKWILMTRSVLLTFEFDQHNTWLTFFGWISLKW